MEGEQHGIRPKWKTTKMKDYQNERRPNWKTTKMKDYQNGCRPKWMTTKMYCTRSHWPQGKQTQDCDILWWNTILFKFQYTPHQYPTSTFGRLPFWLSSILVVFHLCVMSFLSSLIFVVFHFCCLPFWSSSILVVFHFCVMSFLFDVIFV